MKNENRTINHKKNIKVEDILEELKGILSPIEKDLISTIDKPKLPIIIIVGCARSGTTLLYQYLANSGHFVFPTNLMSRFYYAPYVGAKLNQLLIDLDDKCEIFNQEKVKESKFDSELGKTKGASSPHEFWYFWKRFFPFGELQQLTKDALAKVDKVTFLKELAAMQAIYDKPLLMKGMIMNWHIPNLASLSDQIFFIHIKRDIAFNAQSILLARENFFGSMDQWYSFKPEEYHEIKHLPYEEQAVAQVHFTNKAIEEGLGEINLDRYCTVDYDTFCKEPSCLIDVLKNKFSLDSLVNTKKGFKPNKSIKLDKKIWLRILNAKNNM